MAKTFAPRVEKPPCARKSAWYTSTIVARTEVTAGPKRTALAPVPVGWDDDPVTDGSLSEERTKMNAPETASRERSSRSSAMSRRIRTTPYATTGRASANQSAAQNGGRNPSMMCMRSPCVMQLNFR